MRDEDAKSTRGTYYVKDDRFIKAYADDVAAEYEKATRLCSIAEESALFEAPKPIRLDRDRSSIEFELMADPVVSVREVFKRHLKSTPSDATSQAVFRQTGRCLALIHENLQLTTSTVWKLPSNLAGTDNGKRWTQSSDLATGGSPVFLHGDYGFSNIYLKERELESGTIVLWIIDASPNYFMTFNADSLGPAEVDLANFVACMHGLIPPLAQIGCDWSRASELFEALTEGYETDASRNIDGALLRNLVGLTLSAYMKKRVRNSLARNLVLTVLRRRGTRIGL